MVSELATNCIRHTTTSFTVEAEWAGPTIRVDVTDDGGGAPVMQPPDPGNLGGRGLRIVDALSTDWGVIETPNGPGEDRLVLRQSGRTGARSPGAGRVGGRLARLAGASRLTGAIVGLAASWLTASRPTRTNAEPNTVQLGWGGTRGVPMVASGGCTGGSTLNWAPHS